MLVKLDNIFSLHGVCVSRWQGVSVLQSYIKYKRTGICIVRVFFVLVFFFCFFTTFTHSNTKLMAIMQFEVQCLIQYT